MPPKEQAICPVSNIANERHALEDNAPKRAEASALAWDHAGPGCQENHSTGLVILTLHLSITNIRKSFVH